MTRELLFKQGLACTDEVSRIHCGVPFTELDTSLAGVFLRDLTLGRVASPEFSFAIWSRDAVDPLLIRASFSGPVYERYGGLVFWQLFSGT